MHPTGCAVAVCSWLACAHTHHWCRAPHRTAAPQTHMTAGTDITLGVAHTAQGIDACAVRVVQGQPYRIYTATCGLRGCCANCCCVCVRDVCAFVDGTVVDFMIVVVVATLQLQFQSH